MMKLVATANTIEVVEIDKIVSIEACQNYSKFYLTTKQLILSRDSLSQLENTSGPEFYRIHHSYIINLHHVKRYMRNGEVEMNNGKILPVARRRRTGFIESLTKIFEGNHAIDKDENIPG